MTINLLVVEDDDVAAEAIQRSLLKADAKFMATIAEDGLVALDILRGQHPDKTINQPLIVLLDLNMPRMNGFEFLEAIRADKALRSLVVFVLTTSGSDVDRARAYDENIAGYMTKDKVGKKFDKLFNLLTQYVSMVTLPDLPLPSK